MLVRDEIKHVVVLCHPEVDSFNAAVAAKYCTEVERHGQKAVLRDLYRMDFDPVLRANEQPGSPAFVLSHAVARELEIIANANVLVLIYPIWFGTPPAMLKGYVDRVLGSDFSYVAIRARAAASRLEGAHLLSLTSSGTSDAWLAEQGQQQSLIAIFDRYLKLAFSMASTEHVNFPSIVEGMSNVTFRQKMEVVREAVRKTCSVALNDLRSGQVERLSQERAWLRGEQ